MKTFLRTQSMVLIGICIMFQDWDITTKFEGGKQMKREEWKEIDLRHCMVDNLDHHEWHMMFLHCMVDNAGHHEWYLHGIQYSCISVPVVLRRMFHNFGGMVSQIKKCTKFASFATKSAQGMELRRGCCFVFGSLCFPCFLCFVFCLKQLWKSSSDWYNGHEPQNTKVG